MVKRMIDEKHERHDLAFEKFQRARDDGNEDITKRLLFLGILNKWEMADKKKCSSKIQRHSLTLCGNLSKRVMKTTV